MNEKVVKSDGRLREGPSVASPKPPGRVDKLVASVVELSHALTLFAKGLGDGPLRTSCLESAARAKAYALSAQYKSGYGRRPRRDDKRTMAIQARDGDSHDESSSDAE